MLVAINFGSYKHLSAIGKLKYLKELYLCEMHITQTVAKPLANALPSFQLLEKLNVICIFVFSGGELVFSALGTLRCLKKLVLSGICLTKPSATALANAFLSMRFLKKLELLRIYYDDRCAEELLTAIGGKLKYLEKFCVECTKSIICQLNVTEAFSNVLRSLQLLTKLTLRDIYFDNESQVQLLTTIGSLKYLKKLKIFSMKLTQAGTDAFAKAIPLLRLLESLNLQAVKFDDECEEQLLYAVGKLPCLKELWLKCVNITQPGAEALADAFLPLQLLQSLSFLEISFDDGCEDQLFIAVEKLTYLKKLSFAGSETTQSAAVKLTAVLPKLCNLAFISLPEIKNNENRVYFDELKNAALLIPRLEVR